jgi:glycosyltransferase involved in cell wall biosynthesis
MMQDGASGYLVEIGDTEMLAKRIAELLVKPATRRRMAIAAREAAQRRFAADIVADKTVAVYKELVARQVPARALPTLNLNGIEAYKMRVLMIGPHPTTQPPIPLIVERMVGGLEELNCQVETVHYGRHRHGEGIRTKLVERTRDASSILPMLTRDKFDAVILHTSHDWRALLRDLPLVLAARRGKLPYTLLYHGTVGQKLLDARDLNQRLHRWLFGFRARMAAGVFVLARAEEDALKTMWPGCRAATIRLPFVPLHQHEQRSPRKHAEPTLLYVGRLIREKGVLDLIRAMPSVLKQTPCNLIIVGDGPVAAEARDLARELGIEDRVSFMGYLDQQAIGEVLRKASLFVFPTYYSEGFPVAVLEAMGAGLPVVTTRVAGLADWLEEGKHAQFVSPKDPDALALQITALLGDEKVRRRMGKANRELVKGFEPVAAMREYLEYMKEWAGPGQQNERMTRETAPLAGERSGTL